MEWMKWIRWIQHDLTSAVYPTLNLTNPMLTTPRNRIHQFMFVLFCISRGWRTIIHFNYYYYNNTMSFWKTATIASFTRWSLGGLVLWFGFLGMPPRWWWPVDGDLLILWDVSPDDLRLLLYESPHYLAGAQGKRGYAGRCVLKISRNSTWDSNIRDFLHFNVR